MFNAMCPADLAARGSYAYWEGALCSGTEAGPGQLIVLVDMLPLVTELLILLDHVTWLLTTGSYYGSTIAVEFHG